MSKPQKTWEWFRLYNADWADQSLSTLDLMTQGFLFMLVRRMLDQMSPLTLDAIRMLSRQHGLQKKSVDRLVETLQDRDVIYLTDHGFWCDIAEREFVFRDAKTENFSKRNAESSKKRWGKTQSNQSKSMPEKERDTDSGGAPAPSATSTSSSIFTVDDLHLYPDDAIIPPVAAKAARSDIIEFFALQISDVLSQQRGREMLLRAIDSGPFTKARANKIVQHMNFLHRQDDEVAF